MDGISSLGQIMGSGFTSLTNLVQGFSKTNGGEGGANIKTDYKSAVKDMREKLEAMGVEVPESNYSDGILSNQADYQKAIKALGEKQNKADKRYAAETQRAAGELEAAKTEYFSNHHYEIDGNGRVALDGHGRPIASEGPETPEQAAARQKFETQATYEASLAEIEASSDVDASKYPATAELLDLSNNPDKMMELMQSADGSKRLQDLQNQCNYESKASQIDGDVQRMLRVLPSDLDGEIAKYGADCHHWLDKTTNEVRNSSEQHQVDAYQQQMQDEIAAMREKFTSGLEDWQIEDLSMDYTLD